MPRPISYAVFCLKKKKKKSREPSTQLCTRAPTLPPRCTPPPSSLRLFFFNDTATTEIYTLSLHDALPISMRDIKSKNVYSRVNSKATTQWRKTESANGVHLEGVASDNRSS